MNTFKKDVSLFLITMFIITLLWVVFFGLNLENIIGRNDATSGFVWLLNEYDIKSLRELVYNPTIMGGYPVAGALGLMWPLILVLKLTSIEPYHLLNLLILTLQGIIGYFSIKYVEAFVSLSSEKLQNNTEKFFIVSLISFSPLLGWRIGYGHVNLLLGVAAILIVLYALKSLEDNSYSYFDLFLAFLGLSLAINFPAFQIFINAIYLVPFYFLFINQRFKDLKNILNWKIALWFFVFLAINYKFSINLYSYYLGNESTRSSVIDIYGYAPMSWKSFLSVIFLHNDYINISNNFFHWHELHYPIGFGLISLCFLNNDKKRLITALVLAIITIGFVLNLPVLGQIFGSMPLLSKMRVPQRILILISFGMTLSSVIFVLRKIPKDIIRKEHFLYGLLGSLVVLVIMQSFDSYYDLILYLVMILSFVLIKFKERKEFLSAAILMISLISIKTFFAKQLPPFNFHEAVNEIERAKILNKRINPYERTFVNFVDQEFNFNTSLAFELSSLNGYFYGTERFSKLVHALYKMPLNPLHLQWGFNPVSEEGKLLSHLYNIRSVTNYSNNKLIQSELKIEHNGIIFPEKVTFSDDLNLLSDELKKNWKQAFVETHYEKQVSSVTGCRDNEFLSEYYQETSELKLKGNASQDCFLVVPTNYLKSLVVKINNKEAQSEKFPVNHALLGIKLKKGFSEISIYGKF